MSHLKQITSRILTDADDQLRSDCAFDRVPGDTSRLRSDLVAWTIAEVNRDLKAGRVNALSVTNQRRIEKRIQRQMRKRVGSWWNPFVGRAAKVLAQVIVQLTLAYLRTQFPVFGAATAATAAAALTTMIDEKAAA